ncbi:hypothetical protein [Vibrio maritimus]|uniref:hypothetical protein n=1 Tax=Vibrio maritimus TaxID=990268 RepID=UPI0037354CA2
MHDGLLNWYLTKHPDYDGNNVASECSLIELEFLTQEILRPLENQFSKPVITYGFTSHALLLWILKNSPGDMAPAIDQHAAMELNSKANRICKRDGAACDFYLKSHKGKMDKVAQFIIEHLPFDRLYFYGNDKPIHVSVGRDNSRYVQIRKTNAAGSRVPGRYRRGTHALELFDVTVS